MYVGHKSYFLLWSSHFCPDNQMLFLGGSWNYSVLAQHTCWVCFFFNKLEAISILQIGN